jgi:hypothetical protein
MRACAPPPAPPLPAPARTPLGSISRRCLPLVGLVLLAAPAAAAADAAGGGGVSFLTSFLRSRRRADGGQRLLAPVRISRRRLRDAADALLDAVASPAATASRDGLPPPKAYKRVLATVRAASLECFTPDALDGALALPGSLSPPGRNCALGAAARDVAAALPPRDAPLARAMLDTADSAVRAFNLLDDVLDRAVEGDRRAAATAPEAMERALDVVASLETLIAAGVADEFEPQLVVQGQ